MPRGKKRILDAVVRSGRARPGGRQHGGAGEPAEPSGGEGQLGEYAGAPFVSAQLASQDFAQLGGVELDALQAGCARERMRREMEIDIAARVQAQVQEQRQSAICLHEPVSLVFNKAAIWCECIAGRN